jgi:methylaspartate mutase epsilon subunit
VSNPGYFHLFMERQRAERDLVVQPRMGFGSREKMRRGLEAVKDVAAPTIGTITLDSFTRTGDFASAARAIREGLELNGYPIVSHDAAANRELIAGLHSPGFPVQVRHGTPIPTEVFESLIAAGIDATEGGPISYCLPYSRVPLRRSLDAWGSCCRRLAAAGADEGTVSHLESFGGCMLGQLCPPSLLVVITLLEGMFFLRHGLRSISLSYAQNSNFHQDVGAILALRELASEWLPGATWHVVVYTFMGMFPRTHGGARSLIEASARLAATAGCERLIVKTTAEAHQVPSIADNVRAMEWAYAAARGTAEPPEETRVLWHREVVRQQAQALIEAVLDLDPELDRAIAKAFDLGYLDVPYCLHPDNRNQARSHLDHEGTIHWAEPGKIPFPGSLQDTVYRNRKVLTSSDLVRMLAFNQRTYDGLAHGEPQA